MMFPAFAITFFAISGILYIFVLWVMWMIAKCLKSMDESLKEIARSSQVKS
jgi:type IV secretory pathway VirB3-like protein